MTDQAATDRREYLREYYKKHKADWAAARIDEGGCFRDLRAEVPKE